MSQENFRETEENINRYKENITSLTQDFELGLFFYLINKIKWILVVILTISIICSLIYLRYTPEIYKTSANIQIAIKDQPLEFMGMNNYSSNTNLSSELAIIKSQNSIFKLIKKLNLNIFYYNEGEIVSRFLYKRNSYRLESYNVKDSSIISEKIYLKYENNNFSLINEEKKIIYAEFIEPNKFFSSKYISGIIRIDGDSKEFEKNIENSTSYFIIPTKKQIKNEILKGLELNIIDQSRISKSSIVNCNYCNILSRACWKSHQLIEVF